MYQRDVLTITLYKCTFILPLKVIMAETNQIYAVLKQFGCSRNPTVDALTVGFFVNSTESIMTFYKPVIKYINKRLGDIVRPNNNVSDRVDCGFQTMHAMSLLVTEAQDLADQYLQLDVALLQ